MSTIILVHGMWGGPWYLEKWVKYLESKGHTVQAHSLQGHSRDEDVSHLSFRSYVDDVKNLLKRTGPAVLIGHSMGGLITQVVCAEDVRVSAGVLVASAPPRGIFLRKDLLLRMFKLRYLAAMATGAAFLPHDKDLQDLMLNCIESPDSIKKNFVPESGLAAREIATWKIGVDANEVRCPILVVAASKDKMTPLAMQRKIAKKYQAPLVYFPNYGHMLMLEKNWETPISYIANWIKMIGI